MFGIKDLTVLNQNSRYRFKLLKTINMLTNGLIPGSTTTESGTSVTNLQHNFECYIDFNQNLPILAPIPLKSAYNY